MEQDPVPALPKSSSNLKGCLLGCLVVFVVGAVGIGFVSYYTYTKTVGAMDAMTESEARPLPEVVMTEEESTAATEKLDQFTSAIEAETPEEKTYSFTGHEVNLLLRSDRVPPLFGESVFVTIEEGVVHGEVSLDIGKWVPIPFLEGRFVNGNATFSISASDGRLFVFIEDIKMKDKDTPPEILEGLRAQNLAEESMNNPEFKAIMEKVDTIAVDGDHLVITLK